MKASQLVPSSTPPIEFEPNTENFISQLIDNHIIRLRSLSPSVPYPLTTMLMLQMHTAYSTPIQFPKQFRATKFTWSCCLNCFDKVRWTPRPVGGAPSFSISPRSSSSTPAYINTNTNAGEGAGNDKLSMKIGFLGLGIMGSPMAHNLIKAGCDVTVWNRTTSKCESLLNIGAKHGSSPENVASTCDVTFSMLADPGSAMEVACGKQGAVHGLSPGKGYVDVSTVDGETSKAIGIAIKATGAQFLEAPVSGSKKPAEDGKLIFLTSGDKSLYHKVAPILDIMGKSRFYLGDVGKGAAMKLVVNMIMGSMMASFSEGLILGQKLGLDPSVLVEVISQGAISAPMFSMKGPSMVKASYTPAFPLKHQQKDLRLALAMAEEVSQPTPVAAAANELYKVAKAHGLGEEDFSAVIEALKSDLQKN